MEEMVVGNELSFKHLFEILKKGWLRIVIYVLIAVVLGGGISAIAIFATKDNIEYSTIVDFNYKGIEEGVDPLGEAFDVNKIKSNSLIVSVLNDMGFTAENIAQNNLAQKLSDAVAINGYISSATQKQIENDPNFSYTSTRYTISIARNKDINFSDTQYIDFLNKLVVAYKEYFKATYNYNSIIADITDTDLIAKVNDYIDAVVQYDNSILIMENQLIAVKASVPTLYSQLSAAIDNLRNELKSIENYILVNNVVKVSAPITIAANLAQMKSEYQDLSVRYKSNADELATVIASYKMPQGAVSTESGYITVASADVTDYNNLITKFNNYRDLQYQYEYLVEKVTAKESILTLAVCTPEYRTIVENKFVSLSTNMSETVKSVNEKLALFADKNLLNNGVAVAMPASKIQNVSYIIIAITVLVCAVLAFVVAMCVTAKKEKAVPTTVVDTKVADNSAGNENENKQ